MSEKTIEERAKLLPCPFCGSEATLFEPDDCSDYWIACDNPSCSAVMDEPHQNDAVTMWNNRFVAAENKALAAKVEAYEAMLADIRMATFWFPNPADPFLGTNATISVSPRDIEYHLIGELPGKANTFLEAYAALKQEEK